MSHASGKKHSVRTAIIVVAIAAVLGAAVFVVMKHDPARAWFSDVLGVGSERTIYGTTWSWKYTEFPNGSLIRGPGGDLFVLSFGTDSRLTSTTDCNSLFGDFSVLGIGMRVGSLASTKIACPPTSLESEYAGELSRIASFSLSGRELRLHLEDDSGMMVFSKRK